MVGRLNGVVPGSEARAEKWFRIMLVAASVAVFGILVVAAVVLLYMPAPRDNLYFELQRRACLIYVMLWMATAFTAAALAFFPRTLFVSFNLVLLISAEAAAHAYFYLRNGYVYRPLSMVVAARFEPHPLLVAIPRPGRFGDVEHDAAHHRTTWNEGKSAHPKAIFAFGGSTTYDIGNVDVATWPSDLSRRLGGEFTVTNLGVPGYSSLENMIQSLFVFRDHKPTCALYYLGWNDLRNAHLKNLRSDYSDFHLPAQATNLVVDHRPGFLENNVLLVRLTQLMLHPIADRSLDSDGEAPSAKDVRLSGIFMQNVRLIVEIARHFGVTPIFIPQVLNSGRFVSDRSSEWIPRVPDKDVPTLMQSMNEDLAEVAKSMNALFVDPSLTLRWEDGDFVDNGHFSAAGASEFAGALVDSISAHCR